MTLSAVTAGCRQRSNSYAAALLSQQNGALVTPAVVFGWLRLSYPAHRIEFWIPAATLFFCAFINLVRVVRLHRRSSEI